MSTFRLTRSTRAPLLKTLLFSALCAMAVSGCELRVSGSTEADNDTAQHALDRLVAQGKLVTVCLDGTQYWLDSRDLNLNLTPRFDPETKEVRTCSTDAASKEKSSGQ